MASIRSGIGENMENRYLFKAKRLDNGEWVIGNLITNVFFRLGQSIPYILCSDKAEYDCFEDFTEENGIFEVRPDTICQCTGLKDKNGKLIWENDIMVAHLDDYYPEDKTYAKILWRKNGFYIIENGSEDISPIDKFDQDHFEVCGNIFDNAELLESEG